LGQSYIHLILPNAEKTFLLSKASGDHQSFIKKVVSKLKAATWKKPIKAETVKKGARLMAQKL
jgi:hypothetical protein